MTKLVLKTTRCSGDHAFKKKGQENEANCQNSCFRGNSGNSVGDRALNSNRRETERGKTAGDLKERVLWVPLGIPNPNLPVKKNIFFQLRLRYKMSKKAKNLEANAVC